ncbi:MAG TPA: YARHG domain-containing protein [Ignavibacteria bacterium]
MRKLLLLFILSVFFIACEDSSSDKKIKSNSTSTTTTTTTDEAKKKELELKEKELDLKEKELQKDKEIADKEKELADKEKQLQEKNQRIEQNKTTPPPQTNRNRGYYSSGAGSYPEGSSRYLNYNDIYGKTKWQLRVMRNEIFARHGYIFQTSDLRNHFSNQSWYYPQNYDVTNMLSAVEKYNVNFIKGYE